MKKEIIIITIGLFFLLVFTFLALTLGAKDIEIMEILSAILNDKNISENAVVIRDIRLPRVIGAILVGASLSVTGAIMQGLTKNPLADPGILGISAGASLGIVIALIFFPTLSYLGVNISSFLGALFSTLVIFGITKIKNKMSSSSNIVLAGLAVSTLFFSLGTAMGLHFKISKDINMWTSSGLVGTSWIQVKFMAIFIFSGLILSLIYSKELTIFSLSEELAIGLGQNSKKIKTILFIVTIILAGSSTALVGNLMFIGIVVPHFVRWFVGSDYRYILLTSIFAGSSFMVLSDTIARTIKSPYEVPVVAVTTMLGLPFFLFIVNRGIKSFK